MAKKYDQETIELTQVFNALAKMGFWYVDGSLRIVEAQNEKR